MHHVSFSTNSLLILFHLYCFPFYLLLLVTALSTHRKVLLVFAFGLEDAFLYLLSFELTFQFVLFCISRIRRRDPVMLNNGHACNIGTTVKYRMALCVVQATIYR